MAENDEKYVALHPIEDIESRTKFGRLRKSIFVASALLVAMLIGYVGYYAYYPARTFQLTITPRMPGGATRKMDAAFMAPSSLKNTSNVNALQLIEGYDDHCWQFTGGTCNVHECNKWRRAECERSGVFHLCMCPNGCVGADFACYSERNKKIASRVTFKNVAYGEYMYASSNGFYQTLRTDKSTSDNSEFNVYKIPGTIGGQTMYMIGPELYPDYVISMTQSGNDLGSVWAVHDLKPANHWEGDPLYVFWIMCRTKESKIRMGGNWDTSHGDHVAAIWAYEHRFSWLVVGWMQAIWGEPNHEAEWETDEALASQLEEC